MEKDSRAVVFTVGHSTRSLEEFVDLLRHYGVKRLVDVRTIPRSRHNPQFSKETLGPYLRHRHIGYRHMKDLGGLRHAHADSKNTGWQNASFRGFADYMQTDSFAEAVEKLGKIAKESPAAIMCAEAVPWRCHRALIGDALLIRGFEVQDILSVTSVRPHLLTPMARVNGIAITYPAG